MYMQGRSLLCYSTEAGGLGLPEAPSGVQGLSPVGGFWGAKPP